MAAHHHELLGADHAVLQRDRPIEVFGRAGADESVHVTLGDAGVRFGQDLPVDGDVAVAWDEAPQTTATGGKVYSFHAQHEPLLVAAGFVVVGRHTRGGSKWILATSPAGFLMRQPLTFGAQAPRQEDFDAYADALHTYYRGHREELPPEEPGKGIVKAIPVTGGQVKYMAERQQSGGKLSQPLQLGAVVAWKAPGVELVRVWSFGAVGHGRTSASSFNPRAA